MDDFLASIGLHIRDIVAGLAGGLINTILFRESRPWKIVGSIIVGGLAANYVGPPITKLLGTSPEPSAFFVGLAGMAICRNIIKAAISWEPPFSSRKNQND